jgi:OmcA/MtrC family decaheme c-type cytochrome
MNRASHEPTYVSATLALCLAACSGSNGKDGKSCTITQNATGADVLVCTDGTSAVLGSSAPSTAVDGGITPGQVCTVVSNGDGTSYMTCPGADGGTFTVNIRNALVNYTNLGADDKAALDLKVAVSSVTVPATGTPLVAFRVTDLKSGNLVSGLPPADMRFALLKRVAATKGGNDAWVSYMAANSTSTAGAETAAATASAANGALTDNGDGSYLYTFARNITDPANAGTSYDPNATHRLVMLVYESGNPFAPVNVGKDFVPALGLEVTGKSENVDETACLECHSSFRAKAGGSGAFHSGTRYDVKTCVACHNDQRRFATPAVDLDAPGTVDATTFAWTGAATLVNGEAYVNFPVFIHKIHMGEELALAGGSYTGIAKPYENTYPQDSRNCAKCHRNVPQADNFKNKPSRRACGSCHDDISFLATAPAARKPHPGGPQADDSNCMTCHPASAPKSQIGFGVLDSHVAIADPDPNATWLGGSNANTNAGSMPAAGVLPAGAAKITYDVKSVARDAAKHPSIVFRFIKNGAPVVFNTFGVATELMDGFVNSPSAYFAYAVPQDGIAAPADFNASTSGYIKSIWNGTATNGSMTGPDANGYYTITLTATVPDTATMLTGGIGYTYGLSATNPTPPLTEIDLPAFPYGDATVVPGCIAGQKCGGRIVTAVDVSMVATDAATAKAYTARRAIVTSATCIKCHEQLGANPSFHAGQRNDAATCSFCHNPNRTSSGWSASSSSFIHGIHGASRRSVDFTWHAACPPDTSIAAGTCTTANAVSYAKVTYPGILSNCQQCHLAGTYDFSAKASAAALPSLLMSTVGTGTYAAAIGTSPYVKIDGTDYGTGYSTGNLTSGTKDGIACSTAAPCVCSLAAPCEASATTLVNSPITAACAACHDSANEIKHMQMMGGTFYGTRASAMTQSEQCVMCHGPGTVAAIADVHKS